MESCEKPKEKNSDGLLVFCIAFLVSFFLFFFFFLLLFI